MNKLQARKNIPWFLLVIVIVVLMALVAGVIIFWWSNQKQLRPNNEIDSLRTQVGQLQETSGADSSLTPAPIAQPDSSSVFELNKKEAGTKIYYSDKLGIGFTYLSLDPGYTPNITETATKIDLDGQSIEVFTKDPKLTLAEAIKDNFLSGYDQKDCFVKVYETNEQELSNYISAGISFPAPSDPSMPWWQNSVKCPRYYSETNGLQYFLMNNDVPDKFLFVKLGQASSASDGTPRTPEVGFDWSHSIRILK